MRLEEYIINEAKITMKLEKGLYGKVRVIRNYKGYDKLYVIKKKGWGYYISTSYPAKSLDDMIDIEGEFWFRTLKEIKQELGI